MLCAYIYILFITHMMHSIDTHTRPLRWASPREPQGSVHVYVSQPGFPRHSTTEKLCSQWFRPVLDDLGLRYPCVLGTQPAQQFWTSHDQEILAVTMLLQYMIWTCDMRNPNGRTHMFIHVRFIRYYQILSYSQCVFPWCIIHVHLFLVWTHQYLCLCLNIMVCISCVIIVW